MTLHGFVPSEEPAAYSQYIMGTDCQLQAYIPRQRQMSLQIIEIYVPNYTVSNPRRHLATHHYDNHRSHILIMKLREEAAVSFLSTDSVLR